MLPNSAKYATIVLHFSEMPGSIPGYCSRFEYFHFHSTYYTDAVVWHGEGAQKCIYTCTPVDCERFSAHRCCALDHCLVCYMHTQDGYFCTHHHILYCTSNAKSSKNMGNTNAMPWRPVQGRSSRVSGEGGWRKGRHYPQADIPHVISLICATPIQQNRAVTCCIPGWD